MQFNLFGLFISVYVVLFEVIHFINITHLGYVFLSIFLFWILSFVCKYLFVFIGMFSVFVNAILMHLVFHQENPNNLFGRFEVASLSPPSEIREYIISHINLLDLIAGFYILGAMFLFFKFIKTFNSNYKIISFILYIFIILGLFLGGVLQKIIPFNYLYAYYEATQWKSFVKQRKSFIKDNFKYNKKQLFYDTIIVVMGESANKNHMGCYGYEYNTTPFLSDLLRKGGYKFNVIAAANQTRYAIPIDFSNTSSLDFFHFKHSFSIVSDFKSYGYKTYWISNQYKGKIDGYVTSIAWEADIEHFINKNTKSLLDVKLDFELLKPFKKNYNKELKQFFVIHLMGSHFDYEFRYDKIHRFFKNPKNIFQKYDNTIFYTDYVLKNIFNNIKGEFLFVYLSDHSEVVSTTIKGHGFLPPYKNEYEIPFIIYSSIHNKRIDELKQLNIKRFNIENLYYMLKYISFMSDENNVSYSNKVISVSPHNIFEYDKMNIKKEE